MISYMQEHGRERGAAAWLSHEYGGPENEPLHFSRSDSNEVTLTWSQVQRRLLQLMNEGRFTEENRGIFLGERDDTLFFYAPVNFGIQTRFDDAPQPDEDQRIVIASPVCYHGEDFLAAHNITFLKIGRDIEAEQLQGKTDEEQISAMQEAAFGEHELTSEEIEKVIEAFDAAGLSYGNLRARKVLITQLSWRQSR